MNNTYTGAFYQSVQGCTQTFAQLIHNEQKVVDLLLQHLKVKDSMALEALLEYHIANWDYCDQSFATLRSCFLLIL